MKEIKVKVLDEDFIKTLVEAMYELEANISRVCKSFDELKEILEDRVKEG